MFDGLLEYLKDNLPQKIIDGGYDSYEIFGKEAEIPISNTIKEYLNDEKIHYTSHTAANKNAFPDLEIDIKNTKYAFEHKAGLFNMKGTIYNSPANDMGTINSYPDKIKRYSDNMYCTFVKYSVTEDNSIKIDNIYFDKIYKFIGKGKGFDNQLQYREKDGNLRPKSWKNMSNNKVHFGSLKAFEDAIGATEQYRSIRIAEKHIDKLDDKSLENLLKRIDKRF